MSTKKKRAPLRHVLEAVREGGIPVDHSYVYEDDDQNCIVCSIKRISIFNR